MKQHKIVDIITIKFLLVGIINTAVGTGVMFFLYNILHTGYWSASAANYIVGSIVSFFFNKFFTFKNNDKSPKVILRFIVNIFVCYLLAYGFARPCVAHLLINYPRSIQENVAMFVGMCLFVVLNYFGQRFFVFKANVRLSQ